MTSALSDILELSYSSKNMLVSVDVTSISQALATGLVISNADGQLIVQQRIIKIRAGGAQDTIPDFETHQKDLKENAYVVLEDIRSQAIDCLADISGYCKEAQSRFQFLLDDIVNIVASEDIREAALDHIKVLENRAKRRKSNVGSALQALRESLVCIEADVQMLVADQTAVEAVAGPQSVEFKKIQSEIARLRAEMSDEVTAIVTASLAAGGGVALIGLGIISAITGNEDASDIILLGVDILLAGTTSLQEANGTWGSQTEALAKLYSQAAEMNLSLTITGVLVGNVRNFKDALERCLEATEALEAEWTVIEGGLETFRGVLQSVSNSNELQYPIVLLNTGMSEWELTGGRVQKAIDQLVATVPVNLG